MKTDSIYLAEAIKNLRPSSEFSFQEADYSTIVWDVLDGNAPTAKEINDEIARIKTSEANEIDHKASAIAKLAALGLTEDEAKAIIG